MKRRDLFNLVRTSAAAFLVGKYGPPGPVVLGEGDSATYRYEADQGMFLIVEEYIRTPPVYEPVLVLGRSLPLVQPTQVTSFKEFVRTFGQI